MWRYSLYSVVLLNIIWTLTTPVQDVLAETVNMRILEDFGSEIGIGGHNNMYNDLAQPQHLVLKVKPAPVSGPKLLSKLAGRCFKASISNYNYEFCPFHNLTQHEDSSQWNPYHGVLGVWQEWEIYNNTFTAMLMTDGDACGRKFRSARVIFQCASRNRIENVSEPRTCEYELSFHTPLVCHRYSMLVYPTLTPNLQAQWEKLEDMLMKNIITIKGYEKGLKHILTSAGYQLTAQDKEKLIKEQKLEKDSSHRGDFQSLQQCIKAYSDLQLEVESLQHELLALHNDSKPLVDPEV